MTHHRKTTLAALAIVGLLSAGGPAFAGPEVNTSTGIVIADGKPASGLAVHGYDVVAYFTDGKPVKGDSKFAAQHGAATYRFASKAHLDTFQANPEKYVPAYGGFCAFGVSVNAKFDGNPENWKIVDGRLYLKSRQRHSAELAQRRAGQHQEGGSHLAGHQGQGSSRH